MAGIEDIISQIPIGALAKRLGVDESTANAAVQKALPALVGGMRANAESGGADSLAKAVDKHSPKLVDGGVDLDDVDEDDGRKIVKNVFGDNEHQVAAALAGGQGTGGQQAAQGGGLGDVVGKALPMLAPIVMSFLAKNRGGGQGQASGGGIGDLLGGLLGGGGGQAPSSGGGGFGDLLGGLGGLLGGGKK